MALEGTSIIECVVTIQELAGYKYTILYDEAGNRYLKLDTEKIDIKNKKPKFKG